LMGCGSSTTAPSGPEPSNAKPEPAQKVEKVSAEKNDVDIPLAVPNASTDSAVPDERRKSSAATAPVQGENAEDPSLQAKQKPPPLSLSDNRRRSSNMTDNRRRSSNMSRRSSVYDEYEDVGSPSEKKSAETRSMVRQYRRHRSFDAGGAPEDNIIPEEGQSHVHAPKKASTFRGFLNRKAFPLRWQRRWCILEGSHFSYCPEDSNIAVETFDLSKGWFRVEQLKVVLNVMLHCSSMSSGQAADDASFSLHHEVDGKMRVEELCADSGKWMLWWVRALRQQGLKLNQDGDDYKPSRYWTALEKELAEVKHDLTHGLSCGRTTERRLRRRLSSRLCSSSCLRRTAMRA